MKFTRTSLLLITIATLMLVISTFLAKRHKSTYGKVNKYSSSSYAKKFNKAKKFNSKLKTKTQSKTKIDPKFLPNAKGDNNLFAPIRLKFVHVDEKVEFNKRQSPMSEDNYIKFMSMVIKPVEEYFKKVISLFPISGKTDALCQTQVPDMTPEGKKMVQFRQKADDFISNHVSFNK